MGHGTEALGGTVFKLSRINRGKRGSKRMCNLLFHYIKAAILISLYYSCSIGLTFYQKNLFKEFKFPLIVVIIHLLIKFILAGFCREIYSLWKKEGRVTLHWKSYFYRIFPPGFAAGLDIGLSQWSLEFITVTLYTMSKSTALLFILFFAILLKLEEMRWSVIVVVVLIAGGLFMFTYKYTHFNLFGFLLVISASILSGLRWTLSEIVMRKGEIGLCNPIDMVYHIQPWMSLSLMPLAIIMEGEHFLLSEKGFRFHSLTNAASGIWIKVLLGAVLAFFMEVSEFLVVRHTSSLTLSIAGVAKEILTLSLAVYFSHENLSVINQLGLFLCVVGISVHVLLKSMYMTSLPKRTINSRSSISSNGSDSISSVPLLSTAIGEVEED